ncbi:MAG TPA: hypothetical protein VL284_12685 [Thermoanaerobaculia bacterium]|nr:hypothetical protein [Thermoanaerobaculia bacterium]
MLGLALALMLTRPAATTPFPTGQVQLATNHDLWEYEPGWEYTIATGCALIFTCPAYSRANFDIPSPDGVFFEDGQTISFWDGVPEGFLESGKGYTDLFSDDAELSEIAPMGGGRLLVAERWADRARGAKLIEFDLHGRIGDHPFPEVLDANGRALGAEHIELLADRCTLLYTNGLDDPNGNRVRRMNICTDTAESDFATLVAGQDAGAIRQMPDGSVIVANGDAILRFSSDGSLMNSDEFPGVTHVALTPGGTEFWAAGVDNGAPVLRFFGDGSSIMIGNPDMQPPASADDITELVVAGEWRAAVAGPPRRRASR